MSNNPLHLTMSLHIDCLHPCGMMRPILLDKRLPTIDAVWKPVQHQRPVVQKPEHLWSYGRIVLDHVALGDSFLDPHRLVQISENDLLSGHLDSFTRSLHSVHSPLDHPKC